MIKKYSIVILGHTTSISLEPEFWEELTRIAREQNLSNIALITRIDKERKTNLSSAIRLFILSELQKKT